MDRTWIQLWMAQQKENKQFLQFGPSLQYQKLTKLV